MWPNHRGRPIDRFYIERFLERHAGDVHGHVLEVGDATYTHRYGAGRVEASDVLHAEEGNPNATIVADLAVAADFPEARFDCFILTQTLLLVYDVEAAVRTVYRVLKPGGVALVTVPGITQISRGDYDECGQYWSFTASSARRLFEQAFPPERVEVETFGNVLAATAFLHGLAVSELRPAELEASDPDYQLVIGIRATRPPAERPGGAR
jgi:SAM-dependent methyltransferase